LLNAVVYAVILLSKHTVQEDGWKSRYDSKCV